MKKSIFTLRVKSVIMLLWLMLWLGLTACGQTGALYLPQQSQAAVNSSASTA